VKGQRGWGLEEEAVRSGRSCWCQAVLRLIALRCWTCSRILGSEVEVEIAVTFVLLLKMKLEFLWLSRGCGQSSAESEHPSQRSTKKEDTCLSIPQPERIHLPSPSS
jgi:hypothetical protein